MAGTQNLKDLIKFIITSTQTISTIDANQDKKVSFTEALSAITGIGLKIPFLVDSLSEVRDEWKDLSREELDDLVTWFTAEFDLPGLETGKLEAIIKKTAAMVVYNFNYYRDIRDITG